MNSGNDLPGNQPVPARYQRFGARLWFGAACSLALHGLILSLQFGIPGVGLPGLALPWAERRAPVPELSVTLAGVKHAEAVAPPSPFAVEAPPARNEAPGALQVVPPLQRKPIPAAAQPVRGQSRKPIAMSKPRPAVRPKAAPPILARNEPSPDSFKVPVPEPKEQLGEASPEAPPVLAKEAVSPPPETTSAEPQADDKPASTLAAEEEARKVEEARKLDEANALRRAAEARKREEQESARHAAALAEARQEEAKRQAQELAERKALESEASRKEEEAAREKAAALQRQRQAEQLAARAQAEEWAARLKAEEAARRQLAERQAAMQQAELAERQRVAAVAAAAQQKELEQRAALEAQAAAAAAAAGNTRPAAAPGSLSGGDLASKALSQARDLDLARVEPPSTRPPVAGNAERPARRSVFGKIGNDIGLSMYIDSWRLKIERNGRLNYSQSARERARGDPIVTVAIRSDGSVEDIVINRSSGRPELDEAVRRIVRLNARYATFPPALAHRFDVIEIRRIWSFEDSLRILEELETH